jgi:hypothetical protein
VSLEKSLTTAGIEFLKRKKQRQLRVSSVAERWTHNPEVRRANRLPASIHRVLQEPFSVRRDPYEGSRKDRCNRIAGGSRLAAQVIDSIKVFPLYFCPEFSYNDSMVKQYHFIEARNDRFGNRLVLWNTGNYMYEIEYSAAKNTPNAVSKLQSSFEEAKSIFEELCV